MSYKVHGVCSSPHILRLMVLRTHCKWKRSLDSSSTAGAVAMPRQAPLANCRARAWALVGARILRTLCGFSARLHRRRRHHGEDLLLHIHEGDAPGGHPLLGHAALRDVVSEEVVRQHVGVAVACELQDEVVVICPRWRKVED